MQAEFWLKRWRGGQIGFHQADVEKDLAALWPTLELGRGEVFVPLCGKSLDLLWLAQREHPVRGVELSDIAIEAFFLENGMAARRSTTPGFEILTAERISLLQGDIFALSLEQMGDTKAIYDRGSLVSWSGELRMRYAKHMTAISPPGVRTLLITLEYPQSETSGPPFSLGPGEVHTLYGAGHAIAEISRRDILEEDARMRARGVSSLQQVCYLLERL